LFICQYYVELFFVYRGENIEKSVKKVLTNAIICATLDSMKDETTEIDILKRAGLTDSQAKGYMALIENGALSPAQIADKTGETRTNGYAIAEKLEKLGLAAKKDASKASYSALHPNNLELLAEKRRRNIEKNEQIIKRNIPGLIEMFYANNEMPGSRTLAGLDGIKEVYNDTLRTGGDIYLLRTVADVGVLGKDYLDKYRAQRAKRGINTYALTPDMPIAREHMKRADAEMLFHRTLIPHDAYTAPVEIDVYGDKTALIAFGDTQMATIIDSPPIAEAMRQMMKIMTNYFQHS
jgi:sugar-specific transcriptional regulator TrmB